MIHGTAHCEGVGGVVDYIADTTSKVRGQMDRMRAAVQQLNEGWHYVTVERPQVTNRLYNFADWLKAQPQDDATRRVGAVFYAFARDWDRNGQVLSNAYVRLNEVLAQRGHRAVDPGLGLHPVVLGLIVAGAAAIVYRLSGVVGGAIERDQKARLTLKALEKIQGSDWANLDTRTKYRLYEELDELQEPWVDRMFGNLPGLIVLGVVAYGLSAGLMRGNISLPIPGADWFKKESAPSRSPDQYGFSGR